MIQIPINLVAGVANTIHANPGMHAPYNLLNCPPRFRQVGVMEVACALTAHYRKIGPRATCCGTDLKNQQYYGNKQNKLIELGKLCNPKYRRNYLIFGVGGIIHTLVAEMGMGGGYVPMIITIKRRDGTTTYI